MQLKLLLFAFILSLTAVIQSVPVTPQEDTHIAFDETIQNTEVNAPHPGEARRYPRTPRALHIRHISEEDTGAPTPRSVAFSTRSTRSAITMPEVVARRGRPGRYRAGHALIEPIDSLASLASVFGIEVLGAMFTGWVTLGVATWASTGLPVDYVVRSIAISSTFGLAIALAVATNAELFLNPAAAVSALLFGRISLLRAMIGIAGTHVGWIAGAAVAQKTFGQMLANFGLAPGVTTTQAFTGELFGTWLAMMAIFSTNLEKGLQQQQAPWYIGAAFFLPHMALVDRTGASLNPARAIGSSVVSGVWNDQFWISQVPQYIASLLTVISITIIKYLREKIAEEKREIDPALVDENVAFGPDILLTPKDRHAEEQIRAEVRSLQEEVEARRRGDHV